MQRTNQPRTPPPRSGPTPIQRLFGPSCYERLAVMQQFCDNYGKDLTNANH
jgi:hypothetical protein